MVFLQAFHHALCPCRYAAIPLAADTAAVVVVMYGTLHLIAAFLM